MDKSIIGFYISVYLLVLLKSRFPGVSFLFLSTESLEHMLRSGMTD